MCRMERLVNWASCLAQTLWDEGPVPGLHCSMLIKNSTHQETDLAEERHASSFKIIKVLI